MKHIISLFPIPLYTNKLDRGLADEELNFIRQNEKNKRKNVGNWSSVDTQLLEHSELGSLKKFFLENINDYIKNVISPADNIMPYISLSWLNYTYQNGYHHRHCHTNSIISGVFYIEADEHDKIYFHNMKEPIIKFHINEPNKYNSSYWPISVEKNLLLLFPSDLWHEVVNHRSKNTRISLSFNVFFKGKIGSIDELNYLKIE